jgi:hypothetical protein
MSSPSTSYPPAADLRTEVSKPLPQIAPGTIDPSSVLGDAAAAHSKTVLETFNAALFSNDAEKLSGCFYAEQAYWRDIVALTSHLRTILPPMENEQVYKGVSVHSSQYRNAHALAGQGVKVRSMAFFAQHVLIPGDSGPACPPSPFILVLTLAL